MTMKFEDENIKIYAASADDDHTFGDDDDNDLHNRFEDEEEEVTMTSDDDFDEDELEPDDDGTIHETHAEEATIFASGTITGQQPTNPRPNHLRVR